MAEIFKSVLQFHFPKEFDGRLPAHWDIRIRTAAPPYPYLRVFDNPLTTRQDIRIQERQFEDEKAFAYDGPIASGPDNPTDGEVTIEMIEADIPTEIMTDTKETLRMKFGGKILNGTMILNRILGNASYEPGTGPKEEKTEARRNKRKKRGREYTSMREILESGAHADAVEASVDLNDWIEAHPTKPSSKKPDSSLKEVFRVSYQGEVKYFRRRDAANTYASGKPGATVTKIDKLPAGAEFTESVGNDESTGRHPHPHDQNGSHSHANLPDGGGHAHEPGQWGAHRHREDDPMDGQHLNIGGGEHDHLIAHGLQDYVAWSAEVHMTHPWIPGYKRALIRHVKPEEEAEAREATRRDWLEHTIWWMHSTGIANPQAHMAVFMDPATRLIEKKYEMEDGTVREPTLADFEAEEKWFRENTPPEFARQLLESHIIESMTLEMDDENKKVRATIDNRVTELEKDVNPATQTDVLLGEDWRLINAKFATMKRGGKTEFKDEEEIIALAAKLFREIHKRGKVTFKPATLKPTSLELLTRVMERVIKEGMTVEEDTARALMNGTATATVYPRETECLKSFLILIGDGNAYGFIRHMADPKKVARAEAGKFEKKTGLSQEQIDGRFPDSNNVIIYTVRDKLALPRPRLVPVIKEPHRIIPNVKLGEAKSQSA